MKVQCTGCCFPIELFCFVSLGIHDFVVERGKNILFAVKNWLVKQNGGFVGGSFDFRILMTLHAYAGCE